MYCVCEWGFGLGRREVESVIEDYLRVTKRRNPFKGGVPGEGWWSGFMRRHPEITKRKPQQLQMVRVRSSTKDVITHWFNQCLKPTLKKLDLKGKPDSMLMSLGFPSVGHQK